jgi:ring-1,2-phenylacetyl-CoA epoxidase subunit PaaC
MENNLFNYTIQLADNALILGHRLSEWCGHAPILEQDIALSNMALDLIGQARSLYQYAAIVENKGKTEDDLAYLRDVWDFKNCLLVEQPNGDFAATIVRQFLFSAFLLPFYQKLTESTDETLRGIAEKAVKEVAYHLRWSSEWTIRLGDGTAESARKTQAAFNQLFPFIGELTAINELENWAHTKGVGVDLLVIKKAFNDTINNVLAEANLEKPSENWMQSGGKTGQHSEHLGYILADMQFLQRAYPGANW